MDSQQSKADDDIEALFQETIDDRCELQEAQFNIKQTAASICSFNYDDSTMFVPQHNESSDEDEDVLVVTNLDDTQNTSKISDFPQTASSNTINTNQLTPNRYDDSQSFTFMPSLDDSFEKLRTEDDEEASRRYLTINAAPLHRWSYGMLPSIPKRLLERQHCVEVKEEDVDIETTSEQVFEDLNHNTMPVIVGSEVNKNLILKSAWVTERLKHMAKAFNDRGGLVKKAIEDIEKVDDTSEDEDDDSTNKDDTNLMAIPIELVFLDEWKDYRSIDFVKGAGIVVNIKLLLYMIKYNLFNVFEPQGIVYISWLLIMALLFLYNSIYIFYRAVFPYEIETGTSLFYILDLIADLLYLLDMVWVKPRLMYIKNGEWIFDLKRTSKNYLRQSVFIYDLIAIMPFDWAILYLNLLSPPWQRLTRLNRMLKIFSFWEFFARIDTILNSPYMFRILHTLMYKLYIIHIGGCLYYYTSSYEGFGTTSWTFENKGSAYIRCYYFAFRTTTSIGGKLAKPHNDFERFYMTIAWLLGVFIFALVIGQIRDIVANATMNQDYYHDILNKTADYMRLLSIPTNLQKRVRFWLTFTWELQKTFNENEILKVLSQKIRTDIALSVHSHTLSRVELFRNMNRSVLRDLVLKLRPILFLPGEFICKKGEIGHEMYIVNKGSIQVIGGDGTILVTLKEGSVFGEIAIMDVAGYTRRTADVRANGYTQLFALSKSDLWETLKNYPEYQIVLRKKVNKMLKKKNAALSAKEEMEPSEDDQSSDDEDLSAKDKLSIRKVTKVANVESIIKDRPKTPKLFNTVMGVIRPESTISQYFSRSMSISSFDFKHKSLTGESICESTSVFEEELN